ncbi:MAG: HEAT repeat domain-containing protein [Anaerolineaceae bacterium]|nr:HEAT repeat domain-containing protein [Anaerolineaceae bacterium]
MVRYLYLSYHTYDTEFALQVAADLKNNGVALWMDRLDIPTNAAWDDAILKTMKNSDAILVVLSPDYLDTPYCQAELDAAKQSGRAVLAVVARQNGTSDFSRQAIPVIDFTRWRMQTDYTLAFGDLLGIIPDEYKGETPSWENCYLISMIAELEARRSFITVMGTPVNCELDGVPVRPQPLSPALSWPTSFSAIADRGSVSFWDAREYVQHGRIKLRSIYDALQEYPRFVLLGEAGSGKTTALRLLALETARKRLHNPEATPLPCLLYLPVWDTEPSFLDFAYQWWPGGNLAEALEQGDILLFLDGLNEMGTAGQSKVAKIREWLGSQPDIRAIITCRTGDYTGELELNLPAVVAEPMTSAQIRAFAQNYLGNDARSFLEQLMVEGQDERDLARLAETPYLLSALIAIFRDRGFLPRNTGLLLRSLAQVIWEQPVLQQMPGWIPFADLEVMLARLAYTMIRQGRPVDVSQRWALRQLSGKSWWQKADTIMMDVLWIAHHAHLVEIRGRQVRFYHRLIQEYFAAAYLRENGAKPVLARPDFYLGRVAGKWDQTIIALCGIVEDAERVVCEVLSYDPWLALDCIRSGIQVSSGCYGDLLSELFSRLLSMDWPVRRAVVWALGQIGDPAAIPVLVMNGLLDTDWPVRCAAATALGKIGVADVVSGLIEALQDQNHNVREAAADALAQVGSPAVPALIEKLNDTHYPSRSEQRICDYAATTLKQIATPEALHALASRWQTTR